MLNEYSLDGLCGALSYALGIEKPKEAAEGDERLKAYVDSVFGGERADRLVMYNPDAIAEWIYRKYPFFTRSLSNCAELELPLRAVMPSVTPVCFGTMYTGAQPAVHGIQKYEKPIIRIDSLFDALVRAGKRVALITYGNCSLSLIFLEREIDYYHFPNEKIEAVNAKLTELIVKDEYDVIVAYNGNYDSVMHKYGPESPEALAELRLNAHMHSVIADMIAEHWQGHNTLLGFAMDHGCHEIDGGCGSHGLDMEEDLNILHLYKGYPRTK